MTRKEELQDRYEDIAFALMMERFAEERGKELLKENEKLLRDPSKSLPKDLEEKCLRTIRKACAKKETRSIKRLTIKILNKAAIAACIAMLLFVTAFATSAKLKANTINFLVEKFDTRTSFSFSNWNTVVDAPNVLVNWMPEGYSLISQEQNNFRTILVYEGPGEEICNIYVSAEKATVSVDSKNSDSQELSINGCSGIFLDSGKMAYSLTWVAPSSYAVISIVSEGIPLEELLHIAEKIEVA